MNNKGFMMAEVVVVSAIVLVFLAGLYASYNKIYSIYSSRVDYYDVTTLYKLGYYRDVLIEDDVKDLNKYIEEYRDPVKLTGLDSGDVVYLLKKGALDVNVVSDEKKTFQDYVNFLSDSVTFNSNYMMIMESCSTTDKCKYAYLEVYDGTE